MTLKCWQDPCNCASINGFRCKTWKDLFKLKCKHDDEEHSFGLSFLCCPCSFISLSCFLPCIACKEYQVYHTKKDTQDVLIVKQPTSYHSMTNDELMNKQTNISINAPEQTDNSISEPLYYKKSKPIPILGKRPKTKLTLT